MAEPAPNDVQKTTTTAARETAVPAAIPTGQSGATDDRRGFLTRAAAVAIGALIMLVPFAAGLLVFADPLRRNRAGFGFIKVATLESVPDDGVPRAFPVISGRTDAWTFFPNEPIGAVFLRRLKGQAIPEAFQTTCPHAGCMLDFVAANKVFQCPCHNSSFQLDGDIIQPSPAPRPMDSLECKVVDERGVKHVLVRYETFHTGIAEKIAKA
jgi:menaquinol-cytochrome c reductase iron-sulfur subunit